MNFTGTDKKILVGSFTVVVCMSLVFPALGLADNGADKNNVPEMDITSSTVNLVGERPEFPSTATEGELQYDVDRTGTWEKNVWKTDGGYLRQTNTYCWNDDPVNEECVINLAAFGTDGYYDNDNYTLSKSDFENNTAVRLSVESNQSTTYTVLYEFVEQENWNTSDVEYTISWELEEYPGGGNDGGGTISNLPVVGGMISAGEQIVSALVWFIEVFLWFCAWFVELVINAIGILAKSFIFGIDVVNFMLTNYSSMIDGVSGFGSFILIIPVMLLFVELLKLSFIFISILPTT